MLLSGKYWACNKWKQFSKRLNDAGWKNMLGLEKLSSMLVSISLQNIAFMAENFSKNTQHNFCSAKPWDKWNGGKQNQTGVAFSDSPVMGWGEGLTHLYIRWPPCHSSGHSSALVGVLKPCNTLLEPAEWAAHLLYSPAKETPIHPKNHENINWPKRNLYLFWSHISWLQLGKTLLSECSLFSQFQQGITLAL